ncbi:hypothetical protein ACFWN1_26615 [Streptomyces sp. NPDC058459]|uniref:hypothetical protein n=1 Tax=Streptomyces sp. NPDC058459 TaxID=3346508 RepID=UPI00365A0343
MVVPRPASHLKADHLYGRGPAGDLIVVLHPGAERAERYAMRAVRERVLRCAEDRGWTLFHAASVALDDAGVLIAGGAGAGKTTVALALAAHRSARLVAADRAAVTGCGDQVVGMPLSYRIAAGTAAALPPHTGLHHSGEPRSVVPGFGAGCKASFTPAALAAALRTGVRESAPLRLVVLPRLHDDDRPPTATRLDPARALGRWRPRAAPPTTRTGSSRGSPIPPTQPRYCAPAPPACWTTCPHGSRSSP